MAEEIKQVELDSNSVISDRDVQIDREIVSIDFDQTSGSYLIVQPFDDDGMYGGRVVVYPQSPQLEINESVELQTFNRVGDLYYPLDAKFDYVRRRIWIVDTGNNRILKVNMDNWQADLEIDEPLIYPHALSSNLNNGGVFVKGYLSYDRNIGALIYFNSNGEELYRFVYNLGELLSSSSSSFEDGISTSSSSAEISFPTLPRSNSVVYDHVRFRVWWVEGKTVYMADEKNKQIQVYKISEDSTISAISLDVELKTGNAFVVTENLHEERFLVQMNKDNTELLSRAYILR